jgi:multiple sugar transport system permease protein
MMPWGRPSRAARLAVHIVVYVTAATMVLPFAWMVLTAFKAPAEATGQSPTLLPEQWQWRNFVDAWHAAQLGRFYVNSTLVALVVTVLSVAHNALAGFAFAKLRMAGKRPAFMATVGTMLLPYQVWFIFSYIICSRLGYLDSLQGLIVPFLAGAFGIFYMRQAIDAVPDDLLDAGRIDGLTSPELFAHVVVPSVRPALAALAIFTFMASWNSFFWPLIVIDSGEKFTLPLAVAALSSGLYVSSWPVQMAAATIITLPTVVLFLVFQRHFVSGLTLGGVKG